MNTGEDFATAKTKLDAYFEPKKSVEFDIFTFRQVRQTVGSYTWIYWCGQGNQISNSSVMHFTAPSPKSWERFHHDTWSLVGPSKSIESLVAASDRLRIPWKCQCCVPLEAQNSSLFWLWRKLATRCQGWVSCLESKVQLLPKILALYAVLSRF